MIGLGVIQCRLLDSRSILSLPAVNGAMPYTRKKHSLVSLTKMNTIIQSAYGGQ